MRTQSLAGAWEFCQTGTEAWLPACVPGGVHTDLLALGRIPDPFVGDNEKRVQWVAEADWEYRYQFAATPDLLRQPHIWLVCDGLDTLATVSLNGSELGRTANMFRQYRWDAKPLLTAGDNDLRIIFESPVRFAAAQQAIHPMPGVSQAIPGGPYLRKAPCQFGWDWGPQLPPIGIWKDIRLEGYEQVRIEDVRFSQQHDRDQVIVEARVSVQNWEETLCSAVMCVIAPDGQVYEIRTAVTPGNESKLQVVIPDPQIWWPNGYGAQPLYRVNIGASTSLACAQSNCASSRTSGGVPSRSSSTGCPSSPRALTGSRRILSRPASRMPI
jgi:beta-mannosidase